MIRMKQNKIVSLIFCVSLIIVICHRGYADSKIGLAINSRTMAVAGFSPVLGKTSNSPAKMAGLHKGDIVREVNGVVVNNVSDFRTVMKKIPPDTTISIKIERNGKEKTYKVKTVRNITPEIDIVFESLSRRERVSLAIIIDRISNAMPLPPQANLAEWKRGINTQLQTEIESVYTQFKKIFKKFSLVDRNKINSVIEELNFQATDYVSDKTRSKIGQLTGATHLLLVEFSRTPKKNNAYTDIVSKRLINIATGEVLSSTTIYQRYDSSGNLQKIE